ncbi:MAG: ferredoxin [Pseudolactococcus laudensis]
MIIQILPEQCIACGLCHTYNTIFDYDVDGLVRFDAGVTELDLAPDTSLVQAAKECPTRAIVVKEY